MLLMVALLVTLTLVVAFANGANDVSKGVATLVGSGVTDLRRALFWGTAWTVAGGVIAAFASQGLVAVFSGKGLLDATPGTHFLVSVAVGAIGWLIIATRTGLPVSTTHSLVGRSAGAHDGELPTDRLRVPALQPVLRLRRTRGTSGRWRRLRRTHGRVGDASDGRSGLPERRRGAGERDGLAALADVRRDQPVPRDERHAEDLGPGRAGGRSHRDHDRVVLPYGRARDGARELRRRPPRDRDVGREGDDDPTR
ncbi:MAG: hypothetical protein E6J20_00325 [Chloroflexi bacterium]|nr:MAG: hypothetical protein E6J20_00325 [Chloroflexota bacterium]